MKKTLLFALLGLAGILNAAGPARAQVVGTSSIGVVIAELDEVVTTGWSAKKSLLGKTVYNEKNEKVGNVEDLIISLDKKVSYAIIGAGGFVGVGRHDVAIPFTQIKQEGGKLVLTGATKDMVKSMPKFEYATDTSRRDRFVAKAEQDIAVAKSKMVEVEKKAATATGEAKTKMDKDIAVVKQDMKSAEDKLVQLNKAGVKHWKEFEADVSAATARLRKWVDTALS